MVFFFNSLDIASRRAWLSPNQCNGNAEKNPVVSAPINENTSMCRRGRFIVLGSSGECLPVNRRLLLQHDSSSMYSSCDSDSEVFLSAKGSFDGTKEHIDKQIKANSS